jgi:hypothetical protein
VVLTALMGSNLAPMPLHVCTKGEMCVGVGVCVLGGGYTHAQWLYISRSLQRRT